MQLGVLGFVISETVINDCPINQLLFFYHYIVGTKWNVLVLVCCHLGRVRPILLIFAQCSERFWFTGYGFAGFFFRDILGSMDYPLICATVWERCLSLVSSNHDQIQSGWRGSNYDTREMRDDSFSQSKEIVGIDVLVKQASLM